MTTSDQQARTINKIKGIPVTEKRDALPKPSWLKIKAPKNTEKVTHLKNLLKENNMHTVCQEANCPNLCDCFNRQRATFLIMGSICTRRCPFCDVAHGYPLPLDPTEPARIAAMVKTMDLHYVVLTSVDRDDLKDGGAQHFSDCITAIREKTNSKVEILVPDFRGRLDRAMDILLANPPDVLNHNIETVPRLYKQIKPGGNYEHSLSLLGQWHESLPSIPIKSGLMVGLGESDEEVLNVLSDLKQNGVSIVTVGQYLAPSKFHYPVKKYVTPDEFKRYSDKAKELGFTSYACGLLIRSSYNAEELSP